MRRLGSLALLGLLAGLGACRGTMSPLSNKIDVGEEPFFVFVADGEEGVGDLWASEPAGGTPYQITFTRVDERLPALSPDGTMLAFVRARAPGDTVPGTLVVMNLVNGAERRVELAGDEIDRLAWSRDSRMVLARRGEAILTWPAPPARGELVAIPPADAAAADSAFRVLLGDPALGEALPCPDAQGICAALVGGEVLSLSATASHPTRWPGDSVAYLDNGLWTIRPLGGGSTRVIRWTRPLMNPRSITAVGARRP